MTYVNGGEEKGGTEKADSEAPLNKSESAANFGRRYALTECPLHGTCGLGALVGAGGEANGSEHERAVEAGVECTCARGPPSASASGRLSRKRAGSTSVSSQLNSSSRLSVNSGGAHESQPSPPPPSPNPSAIATPSPTAPTSTVATSASASTQQSQRQQEDTKPLSPPPPPLIPLGSSNLNETATLLDSIFSSSGGLSGGGREGRRFDFDTHIMKKIPQGAEAASILVGQMGHLAFSKPVAVFVRLAKPRLLPGSLEVPVPTRFLFLLLGPEPQATRHFEIGRVMATLMSDEVRVQQ